MATNELQDWIFANWPNKLNIYKYDTKEDMLADEPATIAVGFINDENEKKRFWKWNLKEWKEDGSGELLLDGTSDDTEAKIIKAKTENKTINALRLNENNDMLVAGSIEMPLHLDCEGDLIKGSIDYNSDKSLEFEKITDNATKSVNKIELVQDELKNSGFILGVKFNTSNVEDGTKCKLKIDNVSKNTIIYEDKAMDRDVVLGVNYLELDNIKSTGYTQDKHIITIEFNKNVTVTGANETTRRVKVNLSKEEDTEEETGEYIQPTSLVVEGNSIVGDETITSVDKLTITHNDKDGNEIYKATINAPLRKLNDETYDTVDLISKTITRKVGSVIIKNNIPVPYEISEGKYAWTIYENANIKPDTLVVQTGYDIAPIEEIGEYDAISVLDDKIIMYSDGESGGDDTGKNAIIDLLKSTPIYALYELKETVTEPLQLQDMVLNDGDYLSFDTMLITNIKASEGTTITDDNFIIFNPYLYLDMRKIVTETVATQEWTKDYGLESVRDSLIVQGIINRDDITQSVEKEKYKDIDGAELEHYVYKLTLKRDNLGNLVPLQYYVSGKKYTLEEDVKIVLAEHKEQTVYTAYIDVDGKVKVSDSMLGVPENNVGLASWSNQFAGVWDMTQEITHNKEFRLFVIRTRGSEYTGGGTLSIQGTTKDGSKDDECKISISPVSMRRFKNNYSTVENATKFSTLYHDEEGNIFYSDIKDVPITMTATKGVKYETFENGKWVQKEAVGKYVNCYICMCPDLKEEYKLVYVIGQKAFDTIENCDNEDFGDISLDRFDKQYLRQLYKIIFYNEGNKYTNTYKCRIVKTEDIRNHVNIEESATAVFNHNLMSGRNENHAHETRALDFDKIKAKDRDTKIKIVDNALLEKDEKTLGYLDTENKIASFDGFNAFAIPKLSASERVNITNTDLAKPIEKQVLKAGMLVMDTTVGRILQYTGSVWFVMDGTLLNPSFTGSPSSGQTTKMNNLLYKWDATNKYWNKINPSFALSGTTLTITYS